MKIGLISSAGGHLTQMLMLMDAFQGHDVFLVTYQGRRGSALAKTTRTYLLQNIGKSPWRMLMSMPRAMHIVLRERPQLIVSTGSEIAIPFFYLCKALGIKTIFIESWSRVHSPSSTGRVVYLVADLFLVQWQQLLSCYGHKARFEGGVL